MELLLIVSVYHSSASNSQQQVVMPCETGATWTWPRMGYDPCLVVYTPMVYLSCGRVSDSTVLMSVGPGYQSRLG